jgi:hypothetical protein
MSIESREAWMDLAAWSGTNVAGNINSWPLSTDPSAPPSLC